MSTGIQERSRPVAGQMPNVLVLPMTSDMVTRVCDLHLRAFRGMMSARLGPTYIHAFISWFLRAKDAIALVAADRDGAIIGYVIGAPVGYGAAMNRQLALVAARSMIARPWLFFEPQVRATVSARLGWILGSRSALETDGLPRPTMSLVGIAVSPSASGQRVGFALMQAFESKARTLRMASLRLSVYPNNVAARRLYGRCGWNALGSASSTGAIYYGRVMS